MAGSNYGGMSVGLSGDAELLAAIGRIADQFPMRALAALTAEAESLLPVLDELAPIGGSHYAHHSGGDPHVGRLRSTARVLQDPRGGLAVIVAMGGDDVGVAYAIAQEVHTDWQHEHGGEARFFADAVKAEAPLFTARLVARLAADIESLGSGG